jgi:hypothetical protein
MTDRPTFGREELRTRFAGVVDRVFDVAADDENLSALFRRVLSTEHSRRVHVGLVGGALGGLASGDAVDYQRVADWHTDVGGDGEDGRPSEAQYDTVMGAIVTVASATEPEATAMLTEHLTDEVATGLRDAVVYGRLPEMTDTAA